MQPRTLWVKRDAGEATPAGWFLAYVIAVIVLWWLFIHKRETAHEVRGTSACADRSVDIELSSPGLGSKIKRSNALCITPFYL